MDAKELMAPFLESFSKEIEMYAKYDQFYDPWEVYTERPLLGLFVNGIIRGNQDWTAIQEYRVKRKNGYGRCDLYFTDSKTAILTEAKFKYTNYGMLEWNLGDFENYNNNIFEQLITYDESNEKDGIEKHFSLSLILHAFSTTNSEYFDTNIENKNSYEFRKDPNLGMLMQGPEYFYKIIRPSGDTNSDRLSALEVIGQLRELKKN